MVISKSVERMQSLEPQKALPATCEDTIPLSTARRGAKSKVNLQTQTLYLATSTLSSAGIGLETSESGGHLMLDMVDDKSRFLVSQCPSSSTTTWKPGSDVRPTDCHRLPYRRRGLTSHLRRELIREQFAAPVAHIMTA